MAYVKVTPPSVVYHLTRMENLDSILDDGKISRFLDSECWFCESLGKMKAYMEQTVMCAEDRLPRRPHLPQRGGHRCGAISYGGDRAGRVGTDHIGTAGALI